MSATNDGTKIILEADGLGPSGAYKAILAAPADADIMYFFFRAYWDSVTSDPASVNYGWDQVFAFGLGFDAKFPTQRNPPVFSRFFGAGRTSSSVDLAYQADAGGTGKHFAGFSSATTLFLGDVVGSPGEIYHIGNVETLGGTDRRIFTWFPATPTVGLQTVQVWKIQRNLSAPRDVTITVGVNFESLSEANFSNARTSANTIWSQPYNYDDHPEFFPRTNEMIFPGVLIMKNADGSVGRKFIYDHGKVEYWKFTESP